MPSPEWRQFKSNVAGKKRDKAWTKNIFKRRKSYNSESWQHKSSGTNIECKRRQEAMGCASIVNCPLSRDA
jgi:hypothetical protein